MRRILVVRTDRVGDVVMITPMLRELKKKFPDAYLGALTNDRSAAVLHHNPHLDALIVDDLDEGTFWKTVRAIRSHRFTDALLVWPAKRAAYQLFLAGIPRRIGVGHKLYEVITFMRTVIREYDPPQHEAQYCMKLARAIGVTTDDLTPELYVTQQERHWARAYFRQLGIPDQSCVVVVHSGSWNTTPNWSEGRYFELITAMLEKDTLRRVHVLLTAPEMSSGFRRQVADLRDDRIHDITPEVGSLRRLISVIAASHVLVASSTGPLHLASGLGIKTVGIYCRRPLFRAEHWGALGPMAINLEVPEEYCRAHCGAQNGQCGMEDGIHVNDVLQHLDIGASR
jgi:ADP-heptose:LPS heptosyltransferase